MANPLAVSLEAAGRSTEIVGRFLEVRDRYKDDPRLNVVMNAVMENVDDAAACSHRPENVQRLWQDANSRHYMALAILAALDAEHGAE